MTITVINIILTACQKKVKYQWLFQLRTQCLLPVKTKWRYQFLTTPKQKNTYILSKQSKILADIPEMHKKTYILSKQSKSSNMLASYLPTTSENF